jgi:hypothetical protein
VGWTRRLGVAMAVLGATVLLATPAAATPAPPADASGPTADASAKKKCKKKKGKKKKCKKKKSQPGVPATSLTLTCTDCVGNTHVGNSTVRIAGDIRPIGAGGFPIKLDSLYGPGQPNGSTYPSISGGHFEGQFQVGPGGFVSTVTVTYAGNSVYGPASATINIQII